MDTTLTLATDGALLAACWWNAPTVEQMETVEALSLTREREFKKQTAYVQYVVEGTPLFSSGVRAIAERLTREYYSLGIAHCIELRGLQGSATRAFLGGLLLIRGGRGLKPMRVFGDPALAATWLASRLVSQDPSWNAERVATLRSALIDAH